MSGLPAEVSELLQTLRVSFRERLSSYSAAEVGGSPEPKSMKLSILALLLRGTSSSSQLIDDLKLILGTVNSNSVQISLLELLDEGNVEFTLNDGIKVFEITDAGRAILNDKKIEYAQDSNNEGSPRHTSHLETRKEFAMAAVKLTQAVSSLSTSGTQEQIKSGAEILSKAANGIFAILGSSK